MDETTFDSTTYDSAQTLDPAAAMAVGVGTVIFFLIVFVIAYVVGSWLLGRIFKKAGVESWKAWVPVYNTWVLLELGGQKGFWALLSFIPVVNIVATVFMFIAMYEIGMKLGKSGVFVLLAIFLPIVWFIWLAFDNSTWNGQIAVGATDPPYQPPAPVPAPGTAEQQPGQDQNNVPPTAPLIQ